MPLYYIEHACNGHTDQHHHGVELADFAEASAYAVSTARLFHDLVPGERRECGFEVRDASDGCRLKMELSLCLDPPRIGDDDVDSGLLA